MRFSPMMSLFAHEERQTKRQRLGDPLALLDKHINFSAIAQALDQKLSLGKSKRGGRPPYSTELMIRLLLLQQLYNLSDDALEYQVLDRSSFQRFLKLEHSGKAPDAKTIWVWRERLKTHDLIGDISAAIHSQLQQHGFIAKGGQIIDASIIQAPIQHNNTQEAQDIKQGNSPKHWSQSKRVQKDTQARWTRKHGKSYYGYKLHANVDRRWGFIRQHTTSAANEHDSQHFEDILDPLNTAKRMMADSAYASKERERELKAQGYRVDIQHKGNKAKPLSQAQHKRNKRIAKDRVFVEHAFARLSQMGGKIIRCIGLKRASVALGLKVGMYNLMRLARLKHKELMPT